MWTPTTEYVESANVTRLARRHGIGIAELRQRSVRDIAWCWAAVVNDRGLPFSTPYGEVVDLSRGIADPDWEDPGDLSGAENPGAVDVVRAAVKLR